MSTEKGVTNRRSSRREEGTSSIRPDTDNENDNLPEQPQIQQHQHQEKHQFQEPTEIFQDDGKEQSSKVQAKESKTVVTNSTMLEGTKEATIIPTTITKVSSVKIGEDDIPRQVIAVSANKNPTAFFQLARKFLMTNEMCDLSALEGAIVSAIDAAHLLERAQLASIVRIHTSYVTVEPKRRKQVSQKQQQNQIDRTNHVPPVLEDVSSSRLSHDTQNSISVFTTTASAAAADTDTETNTVYVSTSSDRKKPPVISNDAASRKGISTNSSGVRELRRARILITIKRTDSYKRWLNENPLHHQAIITGEDVISDSTNITNVTGSTTPPGCSKWETKE